MVASVPLRLLAQDAADLAIISAALQDAVAKVGDIRFEAKAQRLTVAFNRFRWEGGNRQRVRSALQFGSVLTVQARNLRTERAESVVELLAMTFEAGEAPGGLVTFQFAGGGDLRAELECVDAILADISSPWPTPRKPAHET